MKKRVSVRVGGVVYFGKSLANMFYSHVPDIMEFGYVNENGLFFPDTIPDTESAKWLPIETAPKGVRILLWWKHCTDGRAVGQWSADGDHEGWRCEGDKCLPKNQKDCTHWMPLPKGPSEEGSSLRYSQHSQANW